MIIRLVKMTFQQEKIKEFLNIFETEKVKIRAFEGCRHVELLNDLRNPQIFFTYSLWDSEEYLEKYRSSDFFKATWEKTKKHFVEKPEAWTVQSLAKEG